MIIYWTIIDKKFLHSPRHRWAGARPPTGQPRGLWGKRGPSWAPTTPPSRDPPERCCSMGFRPSLQDPSPPTNASPPGPPPSPPSQSCTGRGSGGSLRPGGGGSVRSRGFPLRLWLGQGGQGGRKMATPDHHLSPEAKSPKPTGLKKTSCPSGRGAGVVTQA